jgi:chloramphenicol-sensitive protein RarD
MNKGVLAGLGAYLMWGLFPIYWKWLQAVPALQILAHRMAWSLLFVVGVLALQRDWSWLRVALRQRKTLLVYTLAAVLLSCNWFIYIWGVNAGYIVETSLGYFINPLVNVLLGVIFFKERLRRAQAVAAILAGLGVLYLTFDYGRLPWIALALAFSFASYGLLKKTAPLNATRSFTLETLVMFLPAVAFLLTQETGGVGAFVHQGWLVTLLLVLAGPVTSVPLILFGVAARCIPLSMIGFLQYLAPTLQFLIGVFIFHEAFPASRLLGFSMIWVALLLYSLDTVLNGRKKTVLIGEIGD